jgi:16S rRNA (guanine527-N7)-methyltransferase
MENTIKAYCNLLFQWNGSINLIQKKSINNMMERHIKDCQQICDVLDKKEKVIDVGSGAGLPGVILAINGFHNLILCEKNAKKATFLRIVKTKLNLQYKILNEDIYNITETGSTIVSRAFGSLSILCNVMLEINSIKGVFLKGETYKQEIKEAGQHYHLDYEIIKSVTNLKSAIIKINNVRRKR